MSLGVGQEGEQHLRGAVGAPATLDATGHGRPDVEALGAGTGEHRRMASCRSKMAAPRPGRREAPAAAGPQRPVRESADRSARLTEARWWVRPDAAASTPRSAARASWRSSPSSATATGRGARAGTRAVRPRSAGVGVRAWPGGPRSPVSVRCLPHASLTPTLSAPAMTHIRGFCVIGLHEASDGSPLDFARPDLRRTHMRWIPFRWLRPPSAAPPSPSPRGARWRALLRPL